MPENLHADLVVGDLAFCDPFGSPAAAALPRACSGGRPPPGGDGDEDGACIVCMEWPADAVLVECGHGGTCLACAGHLWERDRRCPLCRKAFTGVMRIVAEDGRTGEVRPPEYYIYI